MFSIILSLKNKCLRQIVLMSKALIFKRNQNIRQKNDMHLWDKDVFVLKFMENNGDKHHVFSFEFT